MFVMSKVVSMIEVAKKKVSSASLEKKKRLERLIKCHEIRKAERESQTS